MAFIEWTEQFTLNIPQIDDQHRRLVDIVNKFDDAAQKGHGSRIMSEILNDLVGYTQEHFNFEEHLMQEAGYPKFDLHQSQHRQLLQKIERFQFDFNNGGRRITPHVREFLKYWLTSHILKEDLAYAEHVTQSDAPVS